MSPLTNIGRWGFYCPHFVDKEAELREDEYLAKVTVACLLGSSRHDLREAVPIPSVRMQTPISLTAHGCPSPGVSDCSRDGQVNEWAPSD